MNIRIATSAALLLLLVNINCGGKFNNNLVLLNVSYDPTREMYQEINKEFISEWFHKNKQVIEINQSHGGSGTQAGSVINGLEADVVTLALAHDINEISNRGGLIYKEWQKRLPNNSCPYTSTIVFLVREGNPRNIHDWKDLTQNNMTIITPNPKTSGGARWIYLAAWAYALKMYNGDETKTLMFLKQLFTNAPILDAGSRGSTNTFVQRKMGDVLIAWENEAKLIKSVMASEYEIIIPSLSILAEPPVAVVDKVVDKKGTRRAAEEYLKFLYTEKGQEIIAKHFFRPSDKNVIAKHTGEFPPVNLVSVDSVFGGWGKAMKKHFADGGTFDKITGVK
jgi:sulfate transport system substrate-binding protein